MATFPTALDAMRADESTNNEALWHGLVRFERSAGKFDRNPIDLPKFLHELCSALSSLDPHFLFRDKDGVNVSMEALPSTQEACELLFNYQVLEQRNSRQMLFVADMMSSKTIGQLKNHAWAILKRYGIWMFRHDLAVTRLNVRNAGWLLGSHPRYHSSDLQRTLIKQGLAKWFWKLNISAKATWEKRLRQHHGKPVFPDFYCTSRNIRGEFSGIASSSSAFNIVTAAEDTNIFDELLRTAFPPEAEPSSQIGTYIPMTLRRSNASQFLRLVQQQQDYLDKYQIVSVAGITKEIMESPMSITTSSGETHELTVQAAFELDPSITRLDPGSFLGRLGKWSVSTTKEKADEARKWTDTVIEAMPPALRNNNDFDSFPSATRMKASPTTATSPYANIAGNYSIDSLKAHQKARETTTTRRNFSQNPQESDSPPMAIFTTTSKMASTPLTSYARAASYQDSQYRTPGTHYGNDGAASAGPSTVPTWVSEDISSMKATIASLQQTPTITPNDKPTQGTPSTPDLMQMFRQIHQGMQESKSQLTQFQHSMESRTENMDISIRAVQKEQKRSKALTKEFQEDMQAEIKDLRSDYNYLQSRIDTLASDRHQTPVPSPCRKKLKEASAAIARKPPSTNPQETSETNPPVTEITAPGPKENDTADQLSMIDDDSDADSDMETPTVARETADMMDTDLMMDTLLTHAAPPDDEFDKNRGPLTQEGQEPAFPAQDR
jgi:hypothetical protein